ncbi:MAG: FixH family protein [Syntrophobacteraceae bacterium]
MNEKTCSISLPNPARSVSLAMAAALILFISIGCERSPSGPSQVIRLKAMTVTVTGEFRTPGSVIGIKFTDAQGHPVDVGKVTLALNMNMSGMPMLAGGEVSGSNGNYTARVKPQMAGTWIATLHYDGPQGSGQTVFEANVQ